MLAAPPVHSGVKTAGGQQAAGATKPAGAPSGRRTVACPPRGGVPGPGRVIRRRATRLGPMGICRRTARQDSLPTCRTHRRSNAPTWCTTGLRRGISMTRAVGEGLSRLDGHRRAGFQQPASAADAHTPCTAPVRVADAAPQPFRFDAQYRCTRSACRPRPAACRRDDGGASRDDAATAFAIPSANDRHNAAATLPCPDNPPILRRQPPARRPR